MSRCLPSSGALVTKVALLTCSSRTRFSGVMLGMDMFECFPRAGAWLTVHQSWPSGLLPVKAQLCVGLVDVLPPSRSFSVCPGGPVWPSLRRREPCSPFSLTCFAPPCHVAAPGQLLWAGSEHADSVPGAPDCPSDRARVHLQILSLFA